MPSADTETSRNSLRVVVPNDVWKGRRSGSGRRRSVTRSRFIEDAEVGCSGSGPGGAPASAGHLTPATGAVDLVAVAFDHEAQLLRDLVLQPLDVVAHELEDLAAVLADEVVVV